MRNHSGLLCDFSHMDFTVEMHWTDTVLTRTLSSLAYTQVKGQIFIVHGRLNLSWRWLYTKMVHLSADSRPSK